MKKILLVLIATVFLAPLAGAQVALAIAVGSVITSMSGMVGVAFNIPIADSTRLFTGTLIDVYRERVQFPTFLRSFFPSEFVRSKEVSIQVQRMGRNISVDLRRHSEGNLNDFSRSSEKIFVPPYHNEFLVANNHRLYDVAIGEIARGEATSISTIVAETAENMAVLQNTIEGSVELQCANILETGVVALSAVQDIDYKRKAASLVDLNTASDYWTVAASNPFKDFEDAGDFLRNTGKMSGMVINAIFGKEALRALRGNDKFIAEADLRRVNTIDIRMPQQEALGQTSHGEFAAGDYTVRVWSYNAEYDNAAGVSTAFVNPKKVICLPEAPRFKTAFALVPQLIEGGSIPQSSEYLVRDYIDNRRTAHEIHIEAAPLAIPVAIDQIYTFQAIA
tara:strand:+ start:657 stop:1835 length:1179 start_codon:yes stop_codon:yes gene_type:complete